MATETQPLMLSARARAAAAGEPIAGNSRRGPGGGPGLPKSKPIVLISTEGEPRLLYDLMTNIYA